MLKTSPIIDNAPNASSPTFRYAPSSISPRQSSPRHPTALRRPSTSRLTDRPAASSADAAGKSPAQDRSMPPPPALDGSIAAPSLTSTSVNPTSHPLAQEPSASAAKSTSASVPTDESVSRASSGITAAEQLGADHGATLSPNKRRGSPTNRAASSIPSAVPPPEQDESSLAAKRSRPEEKPNKVLPSRYELCTVDDIVELIAHMVSELITTNDAIRVANGGLTRFHSRTAPGISVRDYLQRLARHATLTPPLLLAMVYYIDRLCAMYPEFTINTLTVHRFLITAATVAAKGLSDAFWNNTTYARVGGIRVAELRLLELEFLYRVDWRIVPNPEVLVAYYQGLVERCPGYELEDDGSSEDDELDESE